jgi:hypothetical protein
MKKMLILLSAVLLFAGGCCNNCKAEDLINYVPADTDGVVAVDAERLVNLSHLQDLRKENADFNARWLTFESELQAYGLKTSDLPSKLMVFFKAEAGTQNAGILALTKITEAKLVNLFNLNKDKLSYTVKTIAGRKAYVIAKKAKKEDKAVITYIKPNLALICNEDKAEYFCKVVGKSKNEKMIAANKKADKKALMYILYAKAAKAAKAAPAAPMGQNPMENLESAIIALNLVGKSQKDINLKADLNCTDVQNASQIAMQLKTLVMIMTMQVAQNPDLSKSITEAVKIDQKEKNIKINISISETLLEQIKASAEAKKKQVLAGRKAAPVKAKK